MTNMKAMKLYILEDEIRILQHILQIVNKIDYLEVVGTAAEIAVAAREIPSLKPDIILADIRLKDGDSFHLFHEIGIDDFEAMRSPTGKYRTPPLGGLFARAKGGFYHDGRFATLPDVVDH